MRNRLERTPSTISDATRKKLEKLKFKPKTPVPPPEETTTTIEPNQQNVATEPETAGAEDKEDAAKADWTKLPAATPVAKRNWLRPGDSGGGADDEERDVSPNDKLMWAAMQDEREVIYPHLSDLARRRRGKKRARSSSPTSSPMGKTSSPIINVKKLAQALKSPHPDPTLELWDRYTLSGVGETTPHNPATVDLNDLFATSSPKPAGRNPNATPQKESALRRAITSSRLNFNKRRKIEVEEDVPEDTEGAASKFSLVTSLLDSVTSSIQEPQENQEPSPLSNKENARQDPQRDPERSPSPRKRMRSSPPSSPPCSKNPRTEQAETEAAGLSLAAPNTAGPIEDFGDDDFDDDIFMAIDAQVGNTPVMSRGDSRGVAITAQPAPDPVNPPEQPQPRRSPRKSPRKNNYPPHQAMPPAQAAAAVAVDDYGLDDDDIDDDTLMDLADQAAPTNSAVPGSLGSAVSSASEAHAPAPAATGINLPAEDDMFDDDDFGDDADWDAAELAATQAVASQPPKSQTGHRTSNVAGSIHVCHHGRPEGFV